MLINLLIILLIIVLGFLFSNKYNSEKNSQLVRKKYIKIICLVLILQSGLRNVAIGEDTYTYYLGFEDVKTMSWKSNFEAFKNLITYGDGKDPGYFVFQKIFQIVSLDFQVYLGFIAVLFFSAFGVFLYKNTSKLRDVVIGFLIYSIMFYTFYSFTGIRQTIVTAFLLFAYELLKKKKIIPYVLIIIFISFIHKSVLIFLVFSLFSYVKKTKILIWTSLFLFPIMFILSGRITDFLISLTSSYEEYEHFEEYKPTTFVLLMVLISLVAAFRHDAIIKNNKNAKLYFTAFSFALFFLSLVFEIHGYLRMVQYFSFFMIVLIPEILNSLQSFSQKIKNDITIITVLILLGLHLKTNFANPEKYSFFWQDTRLSNQYYEAD